MVEPLDIKYSESDVITLKYEHQLYKSYQHYPLITFSMYFIIAYIILPLIHFQIGFDQFPYSTPIIIFFVGGWPVVFGLFFKYMWDQYFDYQIFDFNEHEMIFFSPANKYKSITHVFRLPFSDIRWIHYTKRRDFKVVYLDYKFFYVSRQLLSNEKNKTKYISAIHYFKSMNDENGPPH